MKIGLFGYDDTCVMAYDPNTTYLVGIFDNYKDAGNKLGIISSIVQKTCSRKGKAYSETLKIQVSLRLSRRLTREEMIAEVLRSSPEICPESYLKRCVSNTEWNHAAVTQLPEANVLDLWKDLRNRGRMPNSRPTRTTA